ncbi:hypothetical protein HDV03_004888 [Kappamyces sp. JEL0829]|nr:hypothetical protein HDV03_004888 [Kappamyces sp. JEL0829]
MNNSFQFSKLVFGTWRLADKHSSEPADVLVRIKTCLSLGITCFDLADIYGGYGYEELFGKALALEPGLRSQMKIITKCNIQYPVGAGRPEVTTHYYDTSRDYILWSVNRSLGKVGIDAFDVLLLHRPDPLMDADEVAATFKQLRREGKVKHFGVSNFTPSQFELIQSRLDFPLVTNQVEFSVLHPDPLFDGVFDQAQRLRFTPMIWSPLAGGRLFAQEKSEQTARVVGELERVAAEIGPSVTIDQVAYAWILTIPSAPCVVVGTNDLERIKRVVQAQSVVLSKPQWFRILEACQGCEVP